MIKVDYNELPQESFDFPMVTIDKGFRASYIEVSKTHFSAAGCTQYIPEHNYALLKFFNTIERPYQLIMEIPFEEPLNSSIRRFLVSLEAYLEDPNHILTAQEILEGVRTGPGYAEYLKRLRFKSFIMSTGAVLMETPDWFNDMRWYPIKDIGDIFNYQYLIHWKEDVEDYKYGFEPLKISEKYIKLFEDTLTNLLSNSEIERIDPREILLGSSGSICLNSELNKKFPVYKEKETRRNEFSKSRSPTARSVVQVGPQNTRDAVLNNLPDLNKIKLIERQTAEVLEIFSDKTVNRNLLDFEKKYEKFKKNHKWFLCRDFTKEGITKPRRLLRSMLTCLHKAFPDCEAYWDVGFYDNFEILFEDIILNPIRGHGLGMANALTTLMQIVIFEMTVSRMNIDSSAIHLLTHNDDAILGAKKRFQFELYWDKEEKILKGLGLLRNPKKSFFCKNGGVFIEKYFKDTLPNLNKKMTYSRRELYMAYCANIVQAKQIISSQVYIDKETLELNLKRIVTFWGYEFFPNEIHYPAFCGGWYNESIYGVSLDLMRLEKLEYNDCVYRAYLACKSNKLKPRYKKGSYSPPINRLFPLHVPLINEDVNALYDIGTLYDIESKYSTLRTNPELYIKAWESLRKKRRSVYLKQNSKLFKDFILEICQSEEKDFKPLDFMIEKSVMTEIFEKNLDDPYESKNPLLEYLSFLNEIPGIKRNAWGVTFTSQTLTSKLNAAMRKRLKLLFSNLSLTGKLRKDTSVFPLTDFDLFQERYFNTMGYLKVMSESENPFVPLVKDEYANKKISLKKTVYGFYLTKEQYAAFTDNRDTKNIFEFIIKKNITNVESLYELIDNYLLTVKVEEEVYISDEEPEYNPLQKPSGKLRGATPETYQIFRTNWKLASENDLKIFNEVEHLHHDFLTIGSDYGTPYTSEEYKQDYLKLSDQARWIYDSAWGSPFTETEEEDDADVDAGFDLFG